MAKPKSKGKCYLCGNTYTKTGMTRHLKACKRKNIPESKSSNQEKAKFFHIVAQGTYRPYYWMHFEMPANAKLYNLDKFLRSIWLECCGHLSAFTIQEKEYSSSSPGGFDEESMDVSLGDVLESKIKFTHRYDFGSTTELDLRVVGEREGLPLAGGISDKLVEVLARNDPPPIECACGNLATHVCMLCWGEDGWLCDECASEHECGEEMLLPVVNSPRVGVCAYVGGKLT